MEYESREEFCPHGAAGAATDVAAIERLEALEHALHDAALRVLLSGETVAQRPSVPPVAAPSPHRDDGVDAAPIEPFVEWLAVVAFVGEHDVRRFRDALDEPVHVAHVVRGPHAHPRAQHFPRFHVDEDAQLDPDLRTSPVDAPQVMLARRRASVPGSVHGRDGSCGGACGVKGCDCVNRLKLFPPLLASFCAILKNDGRFCLFQVTMMSEQYDLIIIGAGSAGMSAAIYAQRFGLRTMIIGKVVGGLLNDSHRVENWPGIVAIPGFDLMMQLKAHVDSLDIPVKEETVLSVEKSAEGFAVKTETITYTARSLLIATGSKHRHLGVAREDELAGKGVSYCATCDGPFFKGVPVAIVGGGDSAAQAAELLAQHASAVYVIVRKDHMRAEPINVTRLEQNPKVNLLYEKQVKGLIGEKQLEAVKLDSPFEGSDTLKVEGLFIEIGADPQSELAMKLGAELNELKEIMIDSNSRTNVPRLYAAGDCCNRKFKQAITGAAEGVIAAFSAYEDLKE